MFSLHAPSVEPALPIEGTHLNWVDELPAELPGAVHFGPYLQANPGDALFVYPDIGRFRVRNGRQIDIEVAAGCSKERAISFARMAPFGCLVHQRGELPMHASAVVRPADGKTLLIVGVSGAGKSTTAAAFAQRGWKVLNDDLSRLTTTGLSIMVWPGFHALKLWEQSCRFLKIDRGMLPATDEVGQKYFWSSDKAVEPREVSAIIELDRAGESPGQVERIFGSAAIEMLIRQTFRPKLVRASGLWKSYFAQILLVARRVPCFQLSKCHSLAPLDLSEYIEKSIQ